MNNIFLQQLNEETQRNVDTFAACLNDPQFLRDVLRDLPGVDVDSEAVRAALEQVQQQKKKDTDDNDKDQSKTAEKDKDEKQSTKSNENYRMKPCTI